jgi:CheY-specific phosphatase CheX
MLMTAGDHAMEAARIVREVFAEMLSLDVCLSGDTPATAGPDGILSAAVYFACPWRGGAILECPASQAEDFARRLLPQGIKLNRDDVRDSLGEIVNMIAGNFKAVLPDGAAISMPSVVEGCDYTLRVCGGRIVTSLTMRCEAGTFRLLIVETGER